MIGTNKMKPTKHLLGAFTRLARDRVGTSTIELAICVPLLAAMIIPVTDLGMAAYTQMQVANAAQAGADYAAATPVFNAANVIATIASDTNLPNIQPNPGQGASPSPAPAQSCNCVTGTTIGPSLGSPPCGQSCTNGTVGTFVTVTAQVTYTTLFDYTPVLPNSLTLSSQAMVRIK